MMLLKRIVFFVLAMIFILGLTIPNFAYAEEGMVLKDFSVDIWPEYDDPRVLVIYQGTFVNNGSADFSGYVKYKIPKFAIPKEGQINMACEIVNGGNHSCQPYKLEDKGDYVELSWKTTRIIKPGQEYPVFLEFYYDTIKGSPEKSFSYLFMPSYVIQNLNINIKQPLRTEDFQVDPKPLETTVDTKGFSNHKYSYTSLSPEDKIAFKVNYVKKDNEPSLQKDIPQSAQSSGTSNTSSQLPQSDAWKDPIVMGTVIIFILLLVIVVFFALNFNKKTVKEKTSKSSSTNPQLIKEKKKLRQMLLNGKISEETYQELVRDLEEEYNS